MSASGFVLGLYLALIYAPSDSLQGEVQRIFYLHLASFAGAFVGFISTVIGGIAYLRTRNVRWDRLAYAGVEVGLLLAAINIMTGAIYARPIVNAWWTWDPKLTAVSIMALTYASYLMLRHHKENKMLQTLDVREFTCAQRHARIFETFDALAVSEGFEFVNDRKPTPLYRQFQQRYIHSVALLPWTAPLGMVILAIRAGIGLSPLRKVRPAKVIGIQEMVYGFGFVLWLAAGYSLQTIG